MENKERNKEQNMVLDVELIDAEDVKVKEGGEKKRKGYKKYNDAVNRINLVGWIKDEIAKRPDRIIVVKIDDVAREMGPEFEEVGYAVLYQALKAVLFQNGIFLSMATHKDGDKTFVLREVRKGEELAPSYLFVKHRIEQEELLEKEENKKRDIKTDGNGAESPREKVRKEKLALKEEGKEKERQEKIDMREEIKKLKEILHGRLGKKSCMVEIFQFNWNTLTWRMIKRSSVRTHLKLLDVLMGYTSNTENRYRIELTPLGELEEMEKESSEDEEIKEEEQKGEKEEQKEEVEQKGEKEEQKGDIHGVNISDMVEISDTLKELTTQDGSEKIENTEKVENTDNTENIENVQEKKEGNIECPRCGGKNIKTWPTIQVIKTRSGDRKLRHRCTDCNETFSDEDLGINES